jgi:hypothetical protein
MVFLESVLDSKFNPLIHLGRKGTFGLSGLVNKFNAEAELLDDLVSRANQLRVEAIAYHIPKNDHWTAKVHKVSPRLRFPSMGSLSRVHAERKKHFRR